MGPTEDWIEADDGCRLRLRHWPVEAPAYDVLVVHGIGEHAGRYGSLAAAFNEAGASVHGHDQRGHGESEGPRGDLQAFSDLHDDIARVASAAVGQRPWVLYGHSLGGLVAAGYLIRRRAPAPTVAVLSAPAMVTTRTLDIGLKAVAWCLSAVAPGLAMGSSVRGSDLSSDPAVGEAYFADPLVQQKATVRFGRQAFLEMRSLRQRHGEIPVPTLVIHGGDDVLVQPAASAGLVASPKVERVVFDGLRHEAHHEQDAARVLRCVTGWVSGQLTSA